MPQNRLQVDNLPNRITIFRVCLIPVIVACLYLNSVNWPWVVPYHDDLGWIAGWIFVFASFTDFIDGYIARTRNIVTVFGSFLDPIADKFLVVSSLVLLLGLHRVSTIVVIVLILREFYMTSLRLLASTEGIDVPVSWMGKWKTTTQMVGIPLLMAYGKPWGIPMALIGKILIYIATFLSLYSAAVYSYNLFKKFKEPIEGNENENQDKIESEANKTNEPVTKDDIDGQ